MLYSARSTLPAAAQVVCLTLAFACAKPTVSSDPAPRPAPVLLQVNNQNFADADVYAVRLGTNYRVAFAPSHQSITVHVPDVALDNGDLQLVVHLVGSNTEYRTQSVHVDPDDLPLLELQENLALSIFSTIPH